MRQIESYTIPYWSIECLTIVLMFIVFGLLLFSMFVDALIAAWISMGDIFRLYHNFYRPGVFVLFYAFSFSLLLLLSLALALSTLSRMVSSTFLHQTNKTISHHQCVYDWIMSAFIYVSIFLGPNLEMLASKAFSHNTIYFMWMIIHQKCETIYTIKWTNERWMTNDTRPHKQLVCFPCSMAPSS